MKYLVVFAHPNPDSYGAALRDNVAAGLVAGGHEVMMADLYVDGFNPVMSADEHRGYAAIGANHPDPLVAKYIEQLQTAEALVFVYPTWWSGLPAMTKGWLERVFLPGVAFVVGRNDKVKPNLRHVRRLVIVTSSGSPWWYSLIVGNAGRRTIMRTLRLICSRRCRTTYLALDRIDSRTDLERDDFLHEVKAKMAAL